jgi:hypothetical protein
MKKKKSNKTKGYAGYYAKLMREPFNSKALKKIKQFEEIYDKKLTIDNLIHISYNKLQ